MPETGSLAGVFSEEEKVKIPTYKEHAYKLIKDAILYHKLQLDTTYSQEALCQEFGISRTPVREALLELQNEGYIHFCRGKGIQIVSLNEKAIHDILEMRIYLEAAAAELAAKRADEEDLKQIEACLDDNRKNLDSKNIILCYQLDHKFHRAIAGASHNDLVYRNLDDVLNHYLRFEVLTVYQSDSSANQIWKEHEKIYLAIKAHDDRKAYEAAKKHLTDAYSRTLSKYWHN